jgi:tetratricopeptide (TPR) repeat protein
VRHLVTALAGLALTLGVGPALGQPAAGLPASADAAIRQAEWILRRRPSDAGALHRLGDGYVRKARESGDAAYLDRAEAALRQSLALQPGQSGARRHLAYVLYSRHDFAAAAIEAERALAFDPADRHAWGVLGDARLEVGRYAEAEAAYARMGTGDLYADSRRAGLRSLRGDVEGAIADLERAVAAGRSAGQPAESVAWVEWELGTVHFGQGRLEAAAAAYQAALATLPRYYRALAGLAQVRTAQGRHEEARVLYEQAIATVPQPDYVAALGDLLLLMGHPVAARRQYDLVEHIGRLSAANRVLYNRELATFYADHDLKPDQALELARRELDVRRDVYAYDLLAWALYRNGRLDEAQAAMREALRQGTRDARLHFHAGLIAWGRGDRQAAAAHLAEALTINPYFHPAHAALARRLLGELGHDDAR